VRDARRYRAALRADETVREPDAARVVLGHSWPVVAWPVRSACLICVCEGEVYLNVPLWFLMFSLFILLAW
jgi:hypothetical protein